MRSEKEIRERIRITRIRMIEEAEAELYDKVYGSAVEVLALKWVLEED